jgi:Bacterial SH3 domain
MAHPAPPAVPRSRFRALRLLGWALGLAALAWGGAQLWKAQPAVGVAPQAAAAAKAVPVSEPVEEIAFRALRNRLREPASAAFQDVRVHRFGPPDERAVCGRVVAPRETPAGGAEFVVRVILPGGGRTGGAPLPVMEEGPTLPRATANARRRYCRNAEEPRAPQTLPTPLAVLDVARAGSGAIQADPAQGGGAPVVLRRVAVGGGSAVNLRSGPGGGAAVIGVIPRGQILDVFERAPGGWLRVGVGEPWGWAHASLLVEGP